MGTRQRAATVSGQSSFLPVDAEEDTARLEFVERLQDRGFKLVKKDPRWLIVGREGLRAHILYFSEPSKEFGIDGGYVSKLTVTDGKKKVVNYDRGWDVEPPESGKVREFYDDIMGCQ